MGFYHSAKCKTEGCPHWFVGQRIDESEMVGSFTISQSDIEGLQKCPVCGQTQMYRIKDVDPKRWDKLP